MKEALALQIEFRDKEKFPCHHARMRIAARYAPDHQARRFFQEVVESISSDSFKGGRNQVQIKMKTKTPVL